MIFSKESDLWAAKLVLREAIDFVEKEEAPKDCGNNSYLAYWSELQDRICKHLREQFEKLPAVPAVMHYAEYSFLQPDANPVEPRATIEEWRDLVHGLHKDAVEGARGDFALARIRSAVRLLLVDAMGRRSQ